VWEGGALLALTNLLPPFIRNPSGRLGRSDLKYLAGALLLLGASYYVATLDLLSSGNGPDVPPDYRAPAEMSLSRLDAAVAPWTTLSHHPWWMLAALIPVAAVALATLRILRSRLQPLATLALLAALGCALLHQFELAGAALLLALLTSCIEWRELFSRSALPLHVALLVCLAYWVAYGLGTQDWHVPGLGIGDRLGLLLYEFVRSPNVVRVVAVPWARAVPVLGAALALLIAAAAIRVARTVETPPPERVLLVLFVVLLLAVGASHPPRYETRYVFFLYPIAILLALLVIARAVGTLRVPVTVAGPAAVLLSLLGFAATEDFAPRHLWNIDTEAVNFRIGLPGPLAGHYHPRSDVRSAALWLAAHVVPGRDIVVNSYPSVDFYYPASDFFFMEESDPRFENWTCRQGRLDRWSNLPLLHSVSGLEAEVSTGRKVWLVVDAYDLDSLVSKLPPGGWRIEWTSRARDIAILSLYGSLHGSLRAESTH
jgi:hypothetical protein